MQGMAACVGWAGGHATVVHGWLGLPVCYGSPELPITLPYIYIYIYIYSKENGPWWYRCLLEHDN
jgi:hypothetical protein